MSIDKAIYYNRLYDFYDKLLTPKQQEVFQYYFHDDLSYQEIAEILDISRSGVYDTLKRALNLLDEYEMKIGIALRYQELLNQLYDLENEDVNKILESFNKGGQNE